MLTPRLAIVLAHKFDPPHQPFPIFSFSYRPCYVHPGFFKETVLKVKLEVYG